MKPGEQFVKPGEEVVFLPTHMVSNPYTRKVLTVQMHHQRVDEANPGEYVGLNIKDLDENNMSRSGEGQHNGTDEGVQRVDSSVGHLK